MALAAPAANVGRSAFEERIVATVGGDDKEGGEAKGNKRFKKGSCEAWCTRNPVTTVARVVERHVHALSRESDSLGRGGVDVIGHNGG